MIGNFKVSKQSKEAESVLTTPPAPPPDFRQPKDIIIEHHKVMNEFLAQSRDLYIMTNSTDFDQDGKLTVLPMI